MTLEDIKAVMAAMKQYELVYFKHTDATGACIKMVAKSSQDTEVVSTDAKGIPVGFSRTQDDEDEPEGNYGHRSLNLKNFD